MIKNKILIIIFFFILSCSNVEYLLQDNMETKQLKKNVLVMVDRSEKIFTKELGSYFGYAKNYEYILKTSFLENKENKVVKSNQVAEKIDYTLTVNYELFFKTIECKIFSKKIISRFSFTPKSEGYNFGADKSFDSLYSSSVKKNIQKFDDLGPFDTSCLE